MQTYEYLFRDDPRNDLTSDEFKRKIKEYDYDVLLAGFPCQAFSSVGLQLGFEDTILDPEVPPKYFLSSGYLETLERHNQRQIDKGYGFGYRIWKTRRMLHGCRKESS